MKKFVIILLVMILVVTAALTAVSCNGNTNVPGAVWANGETVKYDIMRGTENLGTLTVTLEKLSPNSEATLNATGETYKINSSAHGTRITVTAQANDGTEWLKSESIMDMFTSIASYRKVNYNGSNYELKSRYEDKYYYFSINGGAEERLRVGESGFVDREQLYTVVRAYDLDAGYSGNTTDAIVMNFARTSTPQGMAITVVYSATDALEVLGNPAGGGFAAGGNSSVRIPLRIVENDITYNIREITCR